jgi:sigma-B regulation protein RsbU (phosphoserine phosphatase)
MDLKAFDRLRELSLRIPEGAQELLPIIDFLEAFPEQVTEEALVHVTTLGLARTTTGGIWDGRRWIFQRGTMPAFPTNPGKGWTTIPWLHRDALFGHCVLRAEEVPAALPLLLSISAPLLVWRRLEVLRIDQNRQLALQISRLSTLFDLSRSLGEAETREDLVRLMVTTLMGEFRIPRLLVVDRGGTLLMARGLGKLPEILEGELLHSVLLERGLNNVHELADQDQSLGFVYAADPTGGQLSDEDELFLQTLLNLTSTQLTGLELREARLQSLKHEKDLDLARNIQRQILPRRLPEPEGWECAGANLPYLAVGGDLYDLWIADDPLDPDEDQGERLHLAVGDISGKGLPASLMMTQLSTYLRARADRRVKHWGRLATRLNTRMNEVRDRNRYATLFAASLNPQNGQLRYVNGGHNPPLLVPADGNTAIRLSPTGPMVGLLPGATFGEGQADLKPGDVLVVFTDGYIEAEDVEGRELGEEAIIACVRQHQGASADDIFENLLVTVFQHMEGGGFKDDVTLVVVKRKS